MKKIESRKSNSFQWDHIGTPEKRGLRMFFLVLMPVVQCNEERRKSETNNRKDNLGELIFIFLLFYYQGLRPKTWEYDDIVLKYMLNCKIRDFDFYYFYFSLYFLPFLFLVFVPMPCLVQLISLIQPIHSIRISTYTKSSQFVSLSVPNIIIFVLFS